MFSQLKPICEEAWWSIGEKFIIVQIILEHFRYTCRRIFVPIPRLSIWKKKMNAWKRGTATFYNCYRKPIWIQERTDRFSPTRDTLKSCHARQLLAVPPPPHTHIHTSFSTSPCSSQYSYFRYPLILLMPRQICCGAWARLISLNRIFKHKNCLIVSCH